MDASPDPFTVPVNLRRELLRAGWRDPAIAAMVRTKAWVRVRHGAYVDRAAWCALDERGRAVVVARAAIKQAKTEVVASHTTSAACHEAPTWGLDLGATHLTRRDGRTGHHEAGIHQHSGLILDGDVVEHRGMSLMSPTRTVLEVTTVADTEVALVVADNFLHRGLTTGAELRTRYELSMEHWPESRATDIVIRLADPRISSVFEARFSFFCFRCGLPAPIPQYEVHTPDGHLVAVLDFAWPEHGAYVETNGKEKYLQLLEPGEEPGDVIARERRREELVRQLTGMRGMHLAWQDLGQQVLTEQRVRAHLGSPTRIARPEPISSNA